MAEAYLADAKRSLGEAERAEQDGAYHRTVRRAQECVELALKAVLRLVGVEYPREYEVSAVLHEVIEKFPEWFASEIPRLTEISKRLAEERGPAFYGGERAFVPPASIYGETDAKWALENAAEVLHLCEQLLTEARR
jgi:HEPN domain-containing protein